MERNLKRKNELQMLLSLKKNECSKSLGPKAFSEILEYFQSKLNVLMLF